MSASFPYIHAPESDAPFWQKVRVEGKSLGYFLRNALPYAVKAWRKKRTASPDVVAHFDEQALHSQSPSGLEESRDRLALGMVGDLMWVRGRTANILSPTLRMHLETHDVLLGNLETVVSPSHKVARLWPFQVKFNSETEFLDAFRRADGRSLFSALSIANNHVLDFGDLGLKETLQSLDEREILWSGVRRDVSDQGFAVIQKNGFSIGFYAATYGVNLAAHERSRWNLNVDPGLVQESKAPRLKEIRQVLSDMRAAQVDFKVISLHWGHEYEYYPSVYQLQLARDIVAAGADVIMGHHPHVPQPSEILSVNGYDPSASLSRQITDSQSKPRKALVVYSLGNFVSNLRTFSLESGVVQSLQLERSAEGIVDWSGPTCGFTYHGARDPASGMRRLVSMPEYLADSRRSRKHRAEWDFLRQHMRAETSTWSKSPY